MVLSNQVSANLDHETKSYLCSNSSSKMGKNEKLDKIFWVTKRGYKRNTNGDRVWRLKFRARGIINRDSFRDFKSGQGFQIGAK